MHLPVFDQLAADKAGEVYKREEGNGLCLSGYKLELARRSQVHRDRRERDRERE